MSEVSPPLLFDTTALRQRLARRQMTRADFVMRTMCGILQDNLADINRRFERVALLGDGLDELPLAAGTIVNRYHDHDLLEERLPLPPACQQAILGIGLWHRLNDVPGMLRQAFHALEDDGLLMLVFPGGESLTELRQSLLQAEIQVTGGASQRVHPFIETRDAGGLLQRAGFALPIVDKVRLTITYAHLFDLIRDLRWLGETNCLLRRPRVTVPRRLFPLAADYYQRHFPAEGGRIAATLELLTLIGWKPHASQPQPAKRGSGKLSLGQALTD